MRELRATPDREESGKQVLLPHHGQMSTQYPFLLSYDYYSYLVGREHRKQDKEAWLRTKLK
jgi:hypothetical protein